MFIKSNALNYDKIIKNMQFKSMKSKPAGALNRPVSVLVSLLAASAVGMLSGCSTYPTWLPSSGPSTEQVQQTPDTPSGSGIQIVDVNDAVARKLLASQRLALFLKHSALLPNRVM